MVGKGKVRVTLTLSKKADELITGFSKAVHMKKSEFVEDVCCTFIGDVAKAQQQRRLKEKNAKKQKGQA